MKVYVQFLTLDTQGEVCDLLGTDGVFVLDGRFKLRTWIFDALAQIERLKNVQPDIVGYKIVMADSFRNDGNCIHKWTNNLKIKAIRYRSVCRLYDARAGKSIEELKKLL